jgi:hypothetical protein
MKTQPNGHERSHGHDLLIQSLVLRDQPREPSFERAVSVCRPPNRGEDAHPELESDAHSENGKSLLPNLGDLIDDPRSKVGEMVSAIYRRYLTERAVRCRTNGWQATLDMGAPRDYT